MLIRRCMLCGSILGYVNSNNSGYTDGYCDNCWKIWKRLLEIRLYIEKRSMIRIH